MESIGFDREVAAANGFEIRTDASGKEYSVPVGTPQAPGGGFISPLTTVTGNCGSAYVELYDVGTRKFHMKTGWGVKEAAVSYSWAVTITGPDYTRTYPYSGALAMRNTWSATQTATVAIGGNYSAKATGAAVLWNGNVCGSMNPISTQPIY